MYCEFCGDGPTCCVCERGAKRLIGEAASVRFWVWVNGDWVKLTLRPGESFSHSLYSRTDEGYLSTGDVWEREGNTVVWGWHEDGRDCDGRYSRGESLVCDMTELHGEVTGVLYPMHRPAWQTEDRYQRDYSAEAEGY